jgi:hypothetical protein
MVTIIIIKEFGFKSFRVLRELNIIRASTS